MKGKSCYNPEPPVRATSRPAALFLLCVASCILAGAPQAVAGGDAPPRMHALVNVPFPPYDEKTNAVLLYSQTKVTVVSTEKCSTQRPKAHKILPPKGP